ncbi:PREDICTED: IRK-interacting protein-like isoform X2 [Nelumbo nucifera]|uniref:IRK-interacting protein-like isoform X2 n=1 Tax=Nelumbo nucifera TaxID=4432 RepID=A0A1U7ZWQ3_NELNU|nr:PREDICTED: IRK-interacting protein-like isoform X2 [Nelumbo nucifera]
MEIPTFLCIQMDKLHLGRSRQKKADRRNTEKEIKYQQLLHAIPFYRKSTDNPPRFSLRSEHKLRNEEIKVKKKLEMATRVSNFSDLIQRVTASCLLYPLSRGRDAREDLEDRTEYEDAEVQQFGEEYGDEEEEYKVWEEKKKLVSVEKVREMEVLMGEVFEVVSAVKRAYVGLQEAHCPWDSEKMSAADIAVVTELRRLVSLKDKFRRRFIGAGKGESLGLVSLRDAVAPYEAAIDELKKEVKAKEVEVENLKEKLHNVTTTSTYSGKKGRFHSFHSKRKVSCCQGQVAETPAPELFEETMNQVKETCKSFTALLLSFMRSAHWDIAAAVRSIEAATNPNAIEDRTSAIVGAHHAKYVLESYVCRKIFHGFDNETFYMDGSLSSLLNPEQFRRDCFSQFRDMKAMDPAELLGILPTCQFGKFCSKKYLSIVHSKMEESLFGDLEQRRLIMAGNHPRTEFYGEFLSLAKAVWLLHLLAFALKPAPCHFQATGGTEFHPQYMESVIKFSGGVPVGSVVGFPVSPGFELGNGSVIKARVYLVQRA